MKGQWREGRVSNEERGTEKRERGGGEGIKMKRKRVGRRSRDGHGQRTERGTCCSHKFEFFG